VAGWPLALAFRGSLFITAVFGQFVFIAGPVFIVCLSAEHVLPLITAGVFFVVTCSFCWRLLKLATGQAHAPCGESSLL